MWRHRRRYSGVTLFTANIDKTEFQMVYAGFWLRLAAFIIDAVILSVLIFAIVFCLIFILALTGTVDENQISVVVQLINLVVALAYYVGFETSRFQGTPGKIALKIKVSDEHGQRVTHLRAVGRYFARVLCILTLGIGYLMAGLTRRKQGLHDLVAGCLVLSANAPATDLPKTEPVSAGQPLSLDKA